MTMPAPFVSSVMDVQNDWIDYNGHLNMAYYHVLFDRGSDQAFDLLGIGAAYARARRMTIYAAESHVRYLRELHLGDRVSVSFQLIDCDAKRLRTFQEIRHVDGWVAASCETLSLHVDMAGPKVAPFGRHRREHGGDVRRARGSRDAGGRRALDRAAAKLIPPRGRCVSRPQRPAEPFVSRIVGVPTLAKPAEPGTIYGPQESK